MRIKNLAFILLLFFATTAVGLATETKELYLVTVRTAPYSGPRVSLVRTEEGWRIILSDFGIYFVQLCDNAGKYVLVGRGEVMEVKFPTAQVGDVVLVRRMDRGESEKNRLFTLQKRGWK